MLKYLMKRSGIYLIMIFLTTSAGYFLAVSSLKPAVLEQEKIPRPTPPEQVAASFRGLGLDPDLNPWERYIQWLWGIVTRWDWGRSPNGAFVNAEFADRVMVSTRLFIASIILTLVIGVARCLLRRPPVQVPGPRHHVLQLPGAHPPCTHRVLPGAARCHQHQRGGR